MGAAAPADPHQRLAIVQLLEHEVEHRNRDRARCELGIDADEMMAPGHLQPMTCVEQ